MKKVFKKVLIGLGFLIGCIILAEGYDRIIQFTPANRKAAIEHEFRANQDKMNRITEDEDHNGFTHENLEAFNKLSMRNQELREENKKLQ